MESNSVCYHKIDKRSSNLFITSMVTDWNGRHEVLLQINHKYYNFREKKSSQVVKERENLHLNTDKRDVNVLKHRASYRELGAKNTKARPRERTQPQLWMWLIDLNCNFEYDWLIELPDNELSKNKLSNNQLSGKTTTWQVNKWKVGLQSQSRKR